MFPGGKAQSTSIIHRERVSRMTGKRKYPAQRAEKLKPQEKGLYG
jgi:hypothetical protein